MSSLLASVVGLLRQSDAEGSCIDRDLGNEPVVAVLLSSDIENRATSDIEK